MERQLSEQEQFRREALEALRATGMDPFPAAEVPVSHLPQNPKTPTSRTCNFKFKNMNEVHANIERLEEKAINLKNAKKYLDALKKYEEVIQLKKENFGDRDEGTLRTSGEAAIVCNILSMSFLQKGRPPPNRQRSV